MIHDPRPCDLGEGVFWHPVRQQLFWFDILNGQLMSVTDQGPLVWQFDEMVSAAGWISRDELLIASETALFRFHLETGATSPVCALEADNAATRSNDGRADRQGGFWIGTMGKRGGDDPGAGAIYRWYRGELRQLFDGVTISNAICFAPDGRTAYFTDTATGVIQNVSLDAHGWPSAPPATFLDLTAEGLHPDGAVIDADGNLWNAQWGAGRVAAYRSDGTFLQAVSFNAPHTSCPGFGGADLTTLFVTSALQGMDAAARASYPDAGKLFAAANVARGLPEPQVIL